MSETKSVGHKIICKRIKITVQNVQGSRVYGFANFYFKMRMAIYANKLGIQKFETMLECKR